MSILKNFKNPWEADKGVLETNVLDTNVLNTNVLNSNPSSNDTMTIPEAIKRLNKLCKEFDKYFDNLWTYSNEHKPSKKEYVATFAYNTKTKKYRYTHEREGNDNTLTAQPIYNYLKKDEIAIGNIHTHINGNIPSHGDIFNLRRLKSNAGNLVMIERGDKSRCAIVILNVEKVKKFYETYDNLSKINELT